MCTMIQVYNDDMRRLLHDGVGMQIGLYGKLVFKATPSTREKSVPSIEAVIAAADHARASDIPLYWAQWHFETVPESAFAVYKCTADELVHHVRQLYHERMFGTM